ncbi:MAG: hypothetical protein JKY86_02090 [Gammaproteobacteria bacterium]|nr:hypothetical protein [Gammaproteobacteria bacterium]
MTIEHKELLQQYFELQQVGGWIALQKIPEFDLKGFGTKRIAKLVDHHLLQFTIGATKLGASKQLNNTIRNIIRMEGAEVVEGFTTNGGSKPKKQYPSIHLSKVNHHKIDRIILQVLGAVKQVQCEDST